jgi:hypothetical protein
LLEIASAKGETGNQSSSRGALSGRAALHAKGRVAPSGRVAMGARTTVSSLDGAYHRSWLCNYVLFAHWETGAVQKRGSRTCPALSIERGSWTRTRLGTFVGLINLWNEYDASEPAVGSRWVPIFSQPGAGGSRIREMHQTLRRDKYLRRCHKFFRNGSEQCRARPMHAR